MTKWLFKLFFALLLLIMTNCGLNDSDDNSNGAGNGAPGNEADKPVSITFSGTVQYEDRPFTKKGFTGSTTISPVKFSDIEIVKNDLGGAILGKTFTNATGGYSITVDVPQGESVFVRSLTSTEKSGKNITVKSSQSGRPTYAITSSAVSVSGGSYNKNMIATVNIGSAAPFNVFDTLINGALYIKSITGAELKTATTGYYEPTGDAGKDLLNLSGTFFDSESSNIYLCGTGCTSSDNDGWDDQVILHEFAHYVSNNYSGDSSTGGSHSLTDHFDLRLTWSEGWATFFASAVRDSLGIMEPEYYVDTLGNEGFEYIALSYEIETPYKSSSTTGADNEVAVSSVLWDIYDSNEDTSGFDTLSLGMGSGSTGIWNVFSTYLPTAATVSLEDFWDGWFSNGIGTEGGTNDIASIFQARSIYYRLDSAEPNNDYSTATPLTVGTAINSTSTNPSGNMTFYPVDDADWFSFPYEAANDYTIKTSNPGDGADTFMELYDSDGTTLDISNDDASTINCTRQKNPDCSSQIIINDSNKPSSDQTLYIKVISLEGESNPASYGNYNIVVTSP